MRTKNDTYTLLLLGWLRSSYEKDPETGYDYYGARYYTDRLSVWLSVDPLTDKYPSLSGYNYCANNPVMLVDPDGRKISNPESSGVPAKKQDNGIYTSAQSTTYIPINKLNELISNNKLYVPKRYIPDGGTITPADNLTAFEMWLETPSENIRTGVLKVTANVGYSIINSPYSMLTGKTIGGTPLNSTEKIDAFIDVVPGLLSGGLTKTGQVIKTTKGLPGFNQFVKKTSGITSSEGLPAGMKWQTRAGQSFQKNKIQQQGLKDFDAGLKAGSIGSSINDEIKK